MSVSLNATAQLLMRAGMKQIGEVAFSPAAVLKTLPSMALNFYLWGAMFAYAVSVVSWMVVLSRVEVSFAYAFLSLGFVMVTAFGFFVFNEHVTPLRCAGIVLVCVGVFLISMTKS